MLISCEKCNTSFKVPEGHIKSGGTKVRCSSCKHVWLQHPNAKEVYKTDNTTPTETKKITAKKKKKKKPAADKHLPGAPGYIANNNTPINRVQVLLVVLLTLIASILSILSNHKHLHSFTPFYTQLGINHTDSLAFTKFKVIKTLQDQSIRYIVKGEITNESNQKIYLPPLKLVALTKGGRTLSTKIIEPPQPYISAEQTIEYNEDIVISGSSSKVTLDIGNKWELFFR